MLSYTSFNMPAAVISGGYASTYTYGAEHQRVRLVTVRPDDTLTTLYFNGAGGQQLTYEQETHQSDGRVEHKHYVLAGSEVVGVYVTKSAGVPEMRYYHPDHLGSVAAITNESGAVIERLAYEAFGERRYPNGTPQDRASPLIGITTDRGFTAHEHLDELNLIHMNGRIYDPALGRFMTPDPYVQAPGNLQSLNRYSYVINNPLALTDPSGYGWLRDFFHNPFETVRNTWRKVWHSTVGRIVVTVAAAYFVGPYVGGMYESYAANAVLNGATPVTFVGGISGTTVVVNGAAAGFAGGFVASGGDLNAGLKGAVAGGLFYGVSGLTAEWDLAPRLLAKATTGGLTSTLYGAPFSDGFGSSFLTSGSSELYRSVTGHLPDPLPGKVLPDWIYKEALGVPAGYAVFGLNRGLTGNVLEDLFKQGGLVGRLGNLLPIGNAIGFFHDSLFVRSLIPENMMTNLLTMVPSGLITLGAVLDGPLTVQLLLSERRERR